MNSILLKEINGSLSGNERSPWFKGNLSAPSLYHPGALLNPRP